MNATLKTHIRQPTQDSGFQLNCAPAGAVHGTRAREFLQFLGPLHEEFTPRQRYLICERERALGNSLEGEKPAHLFPSAITRGTWKIALPDWCQDQRSQVTAPADDAEIIVRALNSGAPGVMLDLEDSVVNAWDRQEVAAENILLALQGGISYHDQRLGKKMEVTPSSSVISICVRGLHISQQGIFGREELTSASLFDMARIAFEIDRTKLKHPLCFAIPKSESAEEALWWRDVFKALANRLGWPETYIRCMALVESHPLAFEMEEFLFNLRDHILGLHLGRWNYMASLIDFNLQDPAWVVPDRNSIPHDVPFFQNLRGLMGEICHKRGALAVDGMTAPYPSCEDPVGIGQSASPNQPRARRRSANRYPDLRPEPNGLGQRTLEGTRAAVRTIIGYRNGVLNRKGTTLLDGHVEDQAADRLCRLMIGQRVKHSRHVPIVDGFEKSAIHNKQLITQLFDEEVDKLISARKQTHLSLQTLKEARRVSEAMVCSRFSPV